MGYWPSVTSGWLDVGQVLFCVFMDRDEVKVHKLANKERGQYPAILTEQTWSIKDLVDGSIFPAQVANHIVQFGSSCPLLDPAI